MAKGAPTSLHGRTHAGIGAPPKMGVMGPQSQAGVATKKSPTSGSVAPIAGMKKQAVKSRTVGKSKGY